MTCSAQRYIYVYRSADRTLLAGRPLGNRELLWQVYTKYNLQQQPESRNRADCDGATPAGHMLHGELAACDLGSPYSNPAAGTAGLTYAQRRRQTQAMFQKSHHLQVAPTNKQMNASRGTRWQEQNMGMVCHTACTSTATSKLRRKASIQRFRARYAPYSLPLAKHPDTSRALASQACRISRRTRSGRFQYAVKR